MVNKKDSGMKILKLSLIAFVCVCTLQIGVLAFGKSQPAAADDDIIIPSMGVTLDENGKPDAWISVPKHLRSKGTPIQSDDEHIYLEPKQKPGVIKDLFKGNEGVDFHLQQPSIRVGG